MCEFESVSECVWGGGWWKHLSRLALNNTAVSEKHNVRQVDEVFSDLLKKV